MRQLMHARGQTRRASSAGLARRRRLVALTSVLGLSVSALALTAPAQAGSTPPFTIDGAVPDAGSFRFEDPSGNSQELGPLNGNATKLGVIHNAAPPMLATTNPNAQVDLRNVWLDTKKDSDNESWLYIGWERDSNRGSGVIMYEFMQDAAPAACDYDNLTDAQLIGSCNPWDNRKAGDFILVWDQVGNNVDIILRTWSDSDPGPGVNLVLSTGVSLTAGGTAQAKVSPDGFRGEGAVNLSDTVFAGGSAQCLTFGNVIPGTVTGNSDTADYKDTVLADVTDFVTISNCGAVKVTKVTSPAGGTGSFDYALARSSGAAIRYAADGYSGARLTSATGTLTSDGDNETVIDLIAGNDYTLAETFGASTPYDQASIVCTTEGGVAYTLFSSNPAVTPAGSFPVVEGETTDCVITNTLEQGTLVVRKVVVNDDGGTRTAGDFSFKVDGGDAVAFEADGRNDLTVNQGTYSVVEDGLPIAGYATTYDNCTDVSVVAGGTATCTITNDDQPGTLVVRKVVVNDDGGTRTAGDFSFKVDGGDAVAFEADGRNDLTVNQGTYSVVEDGLPIAGYTTTYDNCTDLAIGLGGTATCTITNDDTSASPTGTTTQRWTLKDDLAITGIRPGGSPTSSVTFRLYSDDTCSTLVGSETDSSVVAGAAATADGITVTESGTYYWRAQYSGDSYNEGFTTACGDEITQILAKHQGRDDFTS